MRISDWSSTCALPIFELADGSKVTLNTATEIRVDYRARERIVRLVRGQALFDVAHAPERPFLVLVAARTVHALRTIFEVRFDKNMIQVPYLTAKVIISAHMLGHGGVGPPATPPPASRQQL